MASGKTQESQKETKIWGLRTDFGAFLGRPQDIPIRDVIRKFLIMQMRF